MPAGIATAAATPSPSAQPSRVFARSDQKPACPASSASAASVPLKGGNSFGETAPSREADSQAAAARTTPSSPSQGPRGLRGVEVAQIRLAGDDPVLDHQAGHLVDRGLVQVVRPVG